jgi:putative ABC transport system permease protein
VTQFPFAPWTELGSMTMVVRTDADPTAVAINATHALQALDKDLPVTGIRTMSATLSTSLGRRRFATMLLAAFAGLALLLAAVGLYGAMAYSVNQSRHEIAVRMALGATPRSIRALILRRVLSLSGMGVLVGWVGSAGMMPALSSQLVGIRPIDPATFVSVATMLLLVSIVATLVPVARASAIDPAAITRDR